MEGARTERYGFVRAFLVIGALLLAVWLLLPAVQGFHVGYNSATDHECVSRILQWCR